MMEVRDGMLLNLCFFDILARRLFRLTSFFGFEGSCEASWSCIRKLAMSEQHRMCRSASGGRFASLRGLKRFSSAVIYSVAMVVVLFGLKMDLWRLLMPQRLAISCGLTDSLLWSYLNYLKRDGGVISFKKAQAGIPKLFQGFIAKA